MTSLSYIAILVIVSISGQTYGNPIVRNPLFETADYLNAEERETSGETLTLEQTQALVEIIWERTEHCNNELASPHCECMQAPELFDIVEANVSIGLQEKDFERTSVVLLFHLESSVCKLPEDSANFTYADYLDGLLTVQPLTRKNKRSFRLMNIPSLTEDPTFSEEQLFYILNIINQTYTSKSTHRCFSSDSTFHDIGLEHDEKASEDDLEKLSSVVITNLLHGECIGESEIVNPDSFVETIFEDFGTSGKISEHDFEHLMGELGLSEAHDHGLLETAQLTEITRSIRTATINNQYSALAADNHSHETHCYSPHELIEVYDAESGITFDHFQDICPSLVQLLVSGACIEEHVHPPTDPNTDPIVYAWATLAVVIVTLLSISGILLVPLLSTKVYDGIMHFFVALAVSTLSGDALLHLLPEALGLHSHDDGDEHEHEEPAEPEMVLGKVLAVVAAIYVFFLFERFLVMCLGQGSHGHSHAKADETSHLVGVDNPNSGTLLEGEVDTKNGDVKSKPVANGSNGAPSKERDQTPSDHSFSGTVLDVAMDDSKEIQKSTFSLTKGMTSLSVMILIGDAVHNIMDGIAIGIAFTLDVFVGISTCIAIFCHEFPHEMGDFAVLVKNGMSNTRAFIWVIISNLFGLGGVYIGITLGSNETLHQWMFAVTAGFFLYVALVDLMPEITRDPNGLKPSVFLMHNVGLLSGWTIMLLIAYFEEDISVG